MAQQTQTAAAQPSIDISGLWLVQDPGSGTWTDFFENSTGPAPVLPDIRQYNDASRARQRRDGEFAVEFIRGDLLEFVGLVPDRLQCVGAQAIGLAAALGEPALELGGQGSHVRRRLERSAPSLCASCSTR